MYKAFPVSELRRHISGDVNREYEEGFIEVDLDPTAPDDIRVIGSSRSRPISRRNSSNQVTGTTNSPQRQDSDLKLSRQDSVEFKIRRDSDLDPNLSPQQATPGTAGNSPQTKLMQIRVDSNTLNNDSPPGLGGSGRGSGSSAIEMVEFQNLDSPNQQGSTPFQRFPDIGLPTVNEHQSSSSSSIFGGKRKLNLLEKNVPLSDSEVQ